MPSLGTLTTYLELEDGSFDRKAQSARGTLKKLGGESRKAVNDIGKLGLGLGTVGAAITANLVNKSAQAARELKNLADVANASTTEFQRQAAGARTVGIENDKLADILKDVNDRIGDFVSTGAGPMADFFENIAPQVGVTADQFRRLSGPQALQLYVDSLEKANVSQEEMTFYMEAIAGDATKLTPLLRNGGEQMRALGDRAEETGRILSALEIERLAQMETAIRESTESFEVLTQKLAAGLSPILIALMNHFTGAAEAADILAEDGDDAYESLVSGAGFVLDAVEGIKRSFQVAGRTLAIFGLSGKDVMLTLARDIVEFPTAATNELIKLLNQIPGMDVGEFGMTELGAEIDREVQLTRQAIDEGWKDINQLLMKPLPSGQFKVLVDEAEEAAEEAVRKAERIRQSMSLQGEGGETEPNAKERDEQERKRAELQKKLDVIRQANLSEVELLREKQAMEIAVLKTADAAKIEIEGGFLAARRELHERHEKELTDLTEKAAEQRRQVEEQKLRAREATTGQILGNLSTLMNTESRKMFEIGKAAAISQSIISTYQGATKALELGWPLGPVAAAAITANGLAKVASIRSQSFGSGGGGSGGGASNTQQVNADAEQVTQRSTSVDISLIGADNRDRAVASSVIEQINDEIERGGRINRVGLA